MLKYKFFSKQRQQTLLFNHIFKKCSIAGCVSTQGHVRYLHSFTLGLQKSRTGLSTPFDRDAEGQLQYLCNNQVLLSCERHNIKEMEKENWYLFYTLFVWPTVPTSPLILAVKGPTVHWPMGCNKWINYWIILIFFTKTWSQRNKEAVQPIGHCVGCLLGEAHLVPGDRSQQVYKEWQTRAAQSHNGCQEVDLHIDSGEPFMCR